MSRNTIYYSMHEGAAAQIRLAMKESHFSPGKLVLSVTTQSFWL